MFKKSTCSVKGYEKKPCSQSQIVNFHHYKDLGVLGWGTLRNPKFIERFIPGYSDILRALP